MFYRRKIILSLLQAFDGQLPKISLQKLLFLFASRQVKPDYDFVPYLYGCYSFSANADLTAMVGHKQLAEDEKSFTRIDTINYISTLNDRDKNILVDIKNNYGKLSANALIKLTYINYPYYAINSVIAKDVLSDLQYDQLLEAKSKKTKTTLYTIGYEGISLEEYLNRLIKNDVKVLVDVRNNPLSMKFGFSKKQLIKFCSGLGMQYVHIPEVGIQSEYRQVLNNQNDYDKLFEAYKAKNLTKTIEFQEQILDLLIQNKRIALTCFEADICQCHRSHLANAITQLPKWKFDLKHI